MPDLGSSNNSTKRLKKKVCLINWFNISLQSKVGVINTPRRVMLVKSGTEYQTVGVYIPSELCIPHFIPYWGQKYPNFITLYPNGYLNKQTMKKFIKITTRNEGGSIVRAWIDADKIVQLSQDSVTQAGDNEGTCIFNDGTVIPVITFNETIDSLN